MHWLLAHAFPVDGVGSLLFQPPLSCLLLEMDEHVGPSGTMRGVLGAGDGAECIQTLEGQSSARPSLDLHPWLLAATVPTQGPH